MEAVRNNTESFTPTRQLTLRASSGGTENVQTIHSKLLENSDNHHLELEVCRENILEVLDTLMDVWDPDCLRITACV